MMKFSIKPVIQKYILFILVSQRQYKVLKDEYHGKGERSVRDTAKVKSKKMFYYVHCFLHFIVINESICTPESFNTNF